MERAGEDAAGRRGSGWKCGWQALRLGSSAHSLAKGLERQDSRPL